MSERFSPISDRSRSSRAWSWRSARLRFTKFATRLETRLRKSGMNAAFWVALWPWVIVVMVALLHPALAFAGPIRQSLAGWCLACALHNARGLYGRLLSRH